MISSMTGYARAETENAERKCVVEIRSVNHRFLDINTRIGSKDFVLEKAIKDTASQRLARGSIEISISLNDAENGKRHLVADDEMIKQYLAAAKSITDKHPVYGEVDLLTLLSLKDIFKYEEPEDNREERITLITETLDKALDMLLEMRKAEGENLKDDILSRLKGIEDSTAKILKTRDREGKEIANKVRAKIVEMFADVDVDEQRVLTEAAIMADRSDIAEEATRLESHIKQARKLLTVGGVAGRKMEFMVQEMNREVNTIGSKSNIFGINSEVVEMKSNMEKIREQAANIE